MTASSPGRVRRCLCPYGSVQRSSVCQRLANDEALFTSCSRARTMELLEAAMTAQRPRVLSTSIGDLPLDEYRLALAGQTWTILHTGAVLSHEDEEQFLHGDQPRLP